MDIIESIHSKFYIHRDIKPDNFSIGLKEESKDLFLLDFGLAKHYKDPTTKIHIEEEAGKKLIGTPLYCSINTHKGIAQSRRDDLEAMYYSILHLLRGNLPWQKLSGKNSEDKFKKFMECKITFKLESLCEGFPSIFVL